MKIVLLALASAVTPFAKTATEMAEVARNEEVQAKFPGATRAQAVSNLGWSRYRVYSSNGCHVDVRVGSQEDQARLVVKVTEISPLLCD